MWRYQCSVCNLNCNTAEALKVVFSSCRSISRVLLSALTEVGTAHLWDGPRRHMNDDLGRQSSQIASMTIRSVMQRICCPFQSKSVLVNDACVALQIHEESDRHRYMLDLRAGRPTKRFDCKLCDRSFRSGEYLTK